MQKCKVLSCDNMSGLQTSAREEDVCKKKLYLRIIQTVIMSWIDIVAPRTPYVFLMSNSMKFGL